VAPTVNIYLTGSGSASITGGTATFDNVSTSGSISLSGSGGAAIDGGTAKLGTLSTTGTLSVNNAKAVLPNNTPGSGIPYTLGGISTTGNGIFDIGNNTVFIDYPSAGQDPIGSIAALIASAYDGGTWMGPGITSSDAQANSVNYGVGYADSADPGNPADLPTDTIEIRYTLLGDANLDGKVNGADFTLMAANFNDSVTAGWDKGDFNNDGAVNGSDFVLLADNFNQFASQSAVDAADLQALETFAAANGVSLSSVPEPASMGLLAVGLSAALARRRRRKPDVT
jgi:hypothetical protein